MILTIYTKVKVGDEFPYFQHLPNFRVVTLFVFKMYNKLEYLYLIVTY